MTAGHVPTATLNALYNNTTAGVDADPAAVDNAVGDIVQTINDNRDDDIARDSSHKSAAVLDHPDKSVTRAKLGDKAVGSTQLDDLSVERAHIQNGAVGSSQLDPTLLQNYGDIAVQAKFTQVDANQITVDNSLATKVDKVTGKGLSTNDYDNIEKTEVANVKNKADTTYVDTKVASVASGSPKGVYATLSALQTAFPTGNASIYLVTADGNWYYWNGSAWVSGGVYQSTGIGDASVTPKQTSFIKKITTSTNLADPSEYLTGYYVNYLTGSLVANANFTSTGYIDVSELTNVVRYGNDQMAFYDTNKTFISGSAVTQATPIEVPIGAIYARFSISNSNLSVFRVNSGQTVLSYTAYTYKYMLQSVTSEETESNTANIGANAEIISAHTLDITRLKTATDLTTAENIIVNGGFDIDSTGWSIFYGTPAIINGKLAVTGGGANAQILVRQSTEVVQANAIRKLYVGFDHSASDNTALNVNVRLFGVTTPGTIAQKEESLTTSTKRYSQVLTTSGNGAGKTMIEFVANYVDSATQSGKVLNLDNVIVIDLTTTFGSGNEPTVTQIEGYLAKHTSNFFDGIGVIKSISDDIEGLSHDGTLTVSKNGKYPSITSAIAKVNLIGKKTTVLVMPGEYKEVLSLKSNSFAHIKFVDKYNTTLVDKTGLYANSPLMLSGSGYFKDMHIVANHDDNPSYTSPYSYGAHMDYNHPGIMIFEDCRFESYQNSAVGIGTHQDQTIIFRNCEFYQDATYDAGAFYCHNSASDGVTNQKIVLINCVIHSKNGYSLRIDDANADGISTLDLTFINNTFYSDTLGHNGMYPNGALNSTNIILNPMSRGNNIATLNA